MVQENFWIRGQRCTNGTRKQKRSPSGARNPERTLRVPKLHYSETAESPVIPGRLNGPSMTFNVKLANGDLEIVDKLVEVQKDVRGNPPAEKPRVGELKTPVTRRQMPRFGVRRRRMRAR